MTYGFTASEKRHKKPGNWSQPGIPARQQTLLPIGGFHTPPVTAHRRHGAAQPQESRLNPTSRLQMTI